MRDQHLVHVALGCDPISSPRTNVLKTHRSQTLIEADSPPHHNAWSSPRVLLLDSAVSKPLSHSTPHADSSMTMIDAKAALVGEEDRLSLTPVPVQVLLSTATAVWPVGVLGSGRGRVLVAGCGGLSASWMVSVWETICWLWFPSVPASVTCCLEPIAQVLSVYQVILPRCGDPWSSSPWPVCRDSTDDEPLLEAINGRNVDIKLVSNSSRIVSSESAHISCLCQQRCLANMAVVGICAP